jgi:LruC domain-containing protein
MKLIKNLVVTALAFLSIQLNAQVTMGFEPNSLPISKSCWAWGSMTGYYSASTIISGSLSARTIPLTSNLPTSTYIKSPWLKPGIGNITFKVRLDGNSATSRSIRLRFIPYNALATGTIKEGLAISDSFTYTFAAPISGAGSDNIRNVSFTIPSSIANTNNVYKVMISFLGVGGTGRSIVDDISIPGTYWANPSNNCLPQSIIVDADTDGVADADDAYPNDATRAYNNFYPAAGFGTLMYEDLWPATGDYDFNDLVIDYRYNLVTNAANKVVEMKGQYVTRAIGASFHNGFAFQLDNLPVAKVTAVSGAKYHGATWFENSANGTEGGQTNVNVIVFDDAQKVLPSPGGSGSNTIPANPRVPLDTSSVTVTFTNTSGQMIALSDVNFNPYIIIDQVRGKELHLPNYLPSAKVNSNFFGQLQDNSIPASGKYYKTKDNLPWALNVTSSIPYTHTTHDFVTAYLKFADWAQSNGTLYTDWYQNSPGFRDTGKLFIP